MTSLADLVTEHHIQARHIAQRTISCRPGVNPVPELKRVGAKFTTRVERRLRKLDVDAYFKRGD